MSLLGVLVPLKAANIPGGQELFRNMLGKADLSDVEMGRNFSINGGILQ